MSCIITLAFKTRILSLCGDPRWGRANLHYVRRYKNTEWVIQGQISGNFQTKPWKWLCFEAALLVDGTAFGDRDGPWTCLQTEHGANFHSPSTARHTHADPNCSTTELKPRRRAQTEPNRTLWTHGENACGPSQVTERHGSSGAKLASNKKDAYTRPKPTHLFERREKRRTRRCDAKHRQELVPNNTKYVNI